MSSQVADPGIFVTVISGQNSTDPSPAGSPVAKGRRLKLVEEKQPVAQAESDEEEVSVPVVANKRTYNRRNK